MPPAFPPCGGVPSVGEQEAEFCCSGDLVRADAWSYFFGVGEDVAGECGAVRCLRAVELGVGFARAASARRNAVTGANRSLRSRIASSLVFCDSIGGF